MIKTVVLTVRPIHTQLYGGKTVKRYIQFFTRVVPLLLVAALLMQVLLPSGVWAAKMSEASSLDLSKPLPPVQEWTDVELQRFVNLAVNEQITVPEAQQVWEKLTPVQRERVGEFLAIEVGISVDNWRQFVKNNATKQSAMPINDNYGELGYPGEIWREPIENVWTYGYPPGATFAGSYWNTPLCDDDPNDPDWTFYFYQPYEWYSRNPDGLRWTSNSAQVYLAFMTAYFGNLNGYSFSWNEARLCIGTRGVDLAGGPDNVKANLFLSPNH